MKEQVSVAYEIMGGQPCIAGTRIPVYMILEAGSIEIALTYYPHLTLEQVKAAFNFARDFMQHDYVRLKRLDENVNAKLNEYRNKPDFSCPYVSLKDKNAEIIKLLESLDK